MFIAVPLGLLGRRFGDRVVLGCGLLLMTAGACLSAWSDGPAGIAVGRTAAGAGAVAMIVLQGKIIADWFSGPRFMIGISVSVSAFAVGMGLAGLVLPPVQQAFGLRGAFLTGAVPAGVALVLFLASYRAPPHAPAVPRRFSLPSRRECLLLVVAGLAWTAYTSGYSAFLSYLPASLASRGYGVALIGVVMTVATWGNVPAILFGGGLAARFGGFRIFLTGTLCLAIGMVGGALAGWPLAWAVVLGVLGAIHPGVIMAIGTLSARPENRTVGMSLFYTLLLSRRFVRADAVRRGGRWRGAAGGRAAGRGGDLLAGNPDLHAAPGHGVARNHAGAGVMAMSGRFRRKARQAHVAVGHVMIDPFRRQILSGLMTRHISDQPWCLSTPRRCNRARRWCRHRWRG